MRAAAFPLRTALRIIGLSVPVLAVLIGTILLCATAVAWWQGTHLLSAGVLLTATVCGLVVWLFVAAFHLTKESALMPVDDALTFRRRVRQHLEELGYEPVQLTRQTLLFKPAFTSYLFGGWVTVAVEHGLARIVGPKVRVEALVRRLRLDSYVDKDHKALTELSARGGKDRLRRVQISFRAPRDHWDGVRRWVLDRLARHGSDVVCEVCILAQSETGIPAGTVETEVRGWLHERKIQAVIHKEYVGRPEKTPGERTWHSVAAISLDDTLRLSDTQSGTPALTAEAPAAG